MNTSEENTGGRPPVPHLILFPVGNIYKARVVFIDRVYTLGYFATKQKARETFTKEYDHE